MTHTNSTHGISQHCFSLWKAGNGNLTGQDHRCDPGTIAGAVARRATPYRTSRGRLRHVTPAIFLLLDWPGLRARPLLRGW